MEPDAPGHKRLLVGMAGFKRSFREDMDENTL